MLQPLNHFLSFSLPVSTSLFLINGPHDIAHALAWTLPFWIILLLDWRGPVSTRPSHSFFSNKFHDGILLTLSGLQVINIGLMLEYVTQLQWNSVNDFVTGLVNLIILRFMVGTSSGTSGIVVAHELIHRRQKTLELIGRLLLCTVCYDHFAVSHKREHHVSLGMTEDIGSARLHESFNDYWRRIYFGSLHFAWHSELKRLDIKHRPLQLKLSQNHVFQGVLFEITLLCFILLIYGWLAGLMFLYQALAAVRILEAVNYFQHWGLVEGEYGNSFGWVTDSWISRHTLIGLSNHIGHHQNPNHHYHEISYSDQGPKLPYGYFIMNLWIKLNNASFQKMAFKRLEQYQQSQLKNIALSNNAVSSR